MSRTLGRGRVRQCAGEAAAEIARKPRAAQPLAFQSEEGKFVERIVGAQIIVEFEAVDDARRVVEPDMLRPQIAMRVDDVAAGRTRREERAAASEKSLRRKRAGRPAACFAARGTFSEPGAPRTRPRLSAGRGARRRSDTNGVLHMKERFRATNPWWLEPTLKTASRHHAGDFTAYYCHLRSHFTLPALKAWELAKRSFGGIPPNDVPRRAGPRSAKPGSLLLLRQEGIAEMSLCKDVLSLQTEQPLVHPQSTAHQQGRPSHTGGHAGPA